MVTEPMIIALAAESTAVPAAGWAALPDHLHYNIGEIAFQPACKTYHACLTGWQTACSSHVALQTCHTLPACLTG